MKTRMRTALIFAAIFSMAASPALATEPAPKWQSVKDKAAGKYAECRMEAEAKAVRKETPAEFAKCESKLTKEWKKAEAKGDGADAESSAQSGLILLYGERRHRGAGEDAAPTVRKSSGASG